MQHSPSEIKEKLLKALNQEHNVVNMAEVREVLTILEQMHITKEHLERTRLGKYVNELRKKTTDQDVARRAKTLVRAWQKLVVAAAVPQENAVNGEKTIRSSLSPPGPGPGYGYYHLPNKPMSPAPNNNKYHQHHHRVRGASPLTVGSPMGSYCSSTSTSPALVSATNLQTGSRPQTPCNIRTRMSSPGQASSSFPNSLRSISPAIGYSRSLNSNDFEARHRTFSPSTMADALHQAINSKLKPSSPAVRVCDRWPKINEATGLEAVARTNAANKRLRKSGDSNKVRKKVCNDTSNVKLPSGNLKTENAVGQNIVNGIDISDSSNDVGTSRDSSRKESKVPSKTSAKKSDIKNSRSKKDLNDSLKDKLATHTRIPKVKTTAQLIEGLRAKNNSIGELSPPIMQSDFGKASCSQTSLTYSRRPANNVLGSADHDLTKTKTELMEKFLQSSMGSESCRGFDSMCRTDITATRQFPRPSRGNSAYGPEACAGPSSAGVIVPDEVDAILGTLPPIPENINWEEDTYPEPKTDEPVADESKMEERLNRLMCEPWDGMNGNYDHDNEFREWHQAVARRSYNNEVLQILPYVNID